MLNLNFHSLPNFLEKVWTTWILSINVRQCTFSDLFSKANLWNIWLKRNNHIFNHIYLSTSMILFKISHMLLAWFSAARDWTRQISNDSIPRSLNFLSGRLADLVNNLAPTQTQEWSSFAWLRWHLLPLGGWFCTSISLFLSVVVLGLLHRWWCTLINLFVFVVLLFWFFPFYSLFFCLFVLYVRYSCFSTKFMIYPPYLKRKEKKRKSYYPSHKIMHP